VLQGTLLLPLDDRVPMGPAAVIVRDQAQAVPMQDLPANPEERERWWDRLTGRAKNPAKPAEAPEEKGEEPVTWPPEDDHE
jgi:hypothetical protein